MFTTFIVHCKFQPLVFYTFWEIDFSIFYPHKCLGTQIWHVRVKVEDQPTVIIWTNLVDPESSMKYTKIQSKTVLGSEEEDF